MVDSSDGIEVVTQAGEGLASIAENPGIIRSYFENLIPDIINLALQVVFAIILYAIGARLIKFAERLVRKSMEKKGADTGVIQFLSAVVRYGLYLVLVMMVLSLFGIATTSVVAVLGSAGVAIGLALQGSLANFAGGVLILLLKPFKVGDYIIQGSNEGTVYEISVFYTKLVTADNKVVVIPNGNLSNSSLTNVSHMDKRMVDIAVGIAYEADIRTAKELLQKTAEAETTRIPEEAVSVFVDNLGASSVDMKVRIWVKAENYWEARRRLTENIKYTLDENGINIPYQQIDVQIKQ